MRHSAIRHNDKIQMSNSGGGVGEIFKMWIEIDNRPPARQRGQLTDRGALCNYKVARPAKRKPGRNSATAARDGDFFRT